jgi:eukaryotic-like serine/threonine-protein kinase
MKHVQEALPDVQKLRPEISASLAAVVERATAKETPNRYATAAETVHDLEQVLAIEVARAGETSGEATTVLRALPGDTADIAPVRLRRPRRVLLLSAIAIGLVGGLVAFFATRTERGPGEGAVPRPGPGQQVRFTSNAAEDYDPQGDQEESGDQTQNVLDGNPSTVWDTETYSAGFEGSNKSGVGIYLEAPSPVAGRRLELTTQTPGWDAEVYAANSVPADLDGWQKISGTTTVGETTRIQLDTGRQEFRYYLLWVASLPEGNKVAIPELKLFS